MTTSRVLTFGRALARQVREPAPPAPEPLDLAPCGAALERAGASVARIRLDARAEPWTATGLQAARGAPVTWLAHGDTWFLTRRGIHLEAAFQLRMRTGGAPPSLLGTGPTHTVDAPDDGPVELCSLFPAELRGPEERIVYDRIMPRRAFRGGFDVVVATWPPGTDVAQRLGEAAGHDPTGLCRREADRLATPVEPPPGWHRHPMLPVTGVHSAHDGVVAAHTQGEVEIIRREARAPLTPTLALRWRWRLDHLASPAAEHTLLTHDYVSVAVEFDDGRDLTYYWSAGLPPEAHYRCPLPHWREREWHLVVRSGEHGLGEWQREERLVAPDRDRAIGGAAPREVVRVWLIATTVCARGDGVAQYADIELVDGDTTVRVL
jgi:DUF3047 family protein